MEQTLGKHDNDIGGRWWIAATVAFVAALLGIGLSSFGIWDPWELRTADAAREMLHGLRDQSSEGLPGAQWLIAQGFAFFGVREWSGRVPIVAAGCLSVALAYAWTRRFSDRQTALYTAVIASTSPLFLFNSRQMLGAAPGFAAQGMLACTATFAVWGVPFRGRTTTTWLTTAMWLGATLLCVGLATLTCGTLLGVLPPLAAIATVVAFGPWPSHDTDRHPQLASRLAVVAIAAVALVLTAVAIAANEAAYSPFIGGFPRGGATPSFDAAIEQVFHSFAPWSAVLPLGFVVLFRSARAPAIEASSSSGTSPSLGSTLPRIAMLWIAYGFAAHTVFTSNFGPAAYLPIVPLAVTVALFVRDVEHKNYTRSTGAVVLILFVALVLRDYVLYPESPTHGLAIRDLKVPEVFNAKKPWAAVLGVFAAMGALGMVASAEPTGIDWKAPYRLLRRQWTLNLPTRLWVVAIGLVWVGVLAFGVVATAAGQSLGISTIGVSLGQKASAVAAVLPLVMFAVQAALSAFSRLGSVRMLPLILSGALFGVYASQGFLPALSAQLSPREVYDTYNALSHRGEPIAEYRVSSRAAAYYAKGSVQTIENVPQLIEFLRSSSRRWAAIPGEDLANIDRSFRDATGRHLFVADARNARVLLVTNEKLANIENQNPLSAAVRTTAPSIPVKVGAYFENQIELLGYKLDLPHRGYVGAGEAFFVTWYFRAIEPSGGAWKIFLHVDGKGQRLNGDHEPVDGLYPVRLWNRGDVILDRQELRVPSTYRPGEYTMFIGFYSGETRLRVVKGPKDNDNRVPAGVVTVR